MAFKFNNSLQRETPIVFNLLIINVLVFLAQLFLDSSLGLTEKLALFPYNSGFFKPYQLVTHMFTHGGFMHILFNMYALWMFGSKLEKFWGPKRFLIFYLVCGLAAGVTQMFLSDAPAVGASGAIMGLLAGFAYLFPNTELYIMFIPIPLKAKYVIPFFILLDVFMGVRQIAGDNVGHFAHLGGAIVGFFLILFWNKTNRKTFY